MVEPASITMSAVTLTGAFNSAVNCFEYVQLGRNFSVDFERSQLKLDVARLRLSRWGEAVGLRDGVELESLRLAPEHVQQAQELLEGIIGLFQEAENVCSRLGAVGNNSLDPATLPDLASSLHRSLESFGNRRQGRTGVRQRAKWALYDQGRLSNLISHVTGFVKDLEDLFPPAARDVEQQLRRSEVAEVQALGGISLLRPVATDVDPSLEAALSKPAETKDTFAINNYNNRIGMQGSTQIFNTPQTINL